MSKRKTYCKKKGPPAPNHPAVSDVYLLSDIEPGPKPDTKIHQYTCWGCNINEGYTRRWRAAKRYVAARQFLQHLQEHADQGGRIPDHVVTLLQTEALAPKDD